MVSVQVLFSFQQSGEISSEKISLVDSPGFLRDFSQQQRPDNIMTCHAAWQMPSKTIPSLSYHGFDHLFSSLLLAHLKKSSWALGMLSALHSSGTGTALTHVAQMLDS